MGQSPVDARWPKVLSLAVHEFRTPMTVVAGYIRMLLKDRAGPLSDQQRRLLEEAEKSCGRLSALLGEMSDLSGLEAGTATFNRVSIDIRTTLSESVSALPEVPDRHIDIDLEVGSGQALVHGDPVRLRAAFTAVLVALRRELVSSTTLAVRETTRQFVGRAASWIAIADPDQVATVGRADDSGLAVFDEWRGGSGLSLGVARRVFEAHGGRIWSPAADAKAGAIIALPHA
jgi:signal transduction histidine kinase